MDRSPRFWDTRGRVFTDPEGVSVSHRYRRGLRIQIVANAGIPEAAILKHYEEGLHATKGRCRRTRSVSETWTSERSRTVFSPHRDGQMLIDPQTGLPNSAKDGRAGEGDGALADSLPETVEKRTRAMSFADHVGLPVSKSLMNGFRKHCVAYYFEVQIVSSNARHAWDDGDQQQAPEISVGFALTEANEAQKSEKSEQSEKSKQSKQSKQTEKTESTEKTDTSPQFTAAWLFQSNGSVVVVHDGDTQTGNKVFEEQVSPGGFRGDDVVGCGVEIGGDNRLFFTVNGRIVTTLENFGPKIFQFRQGKQEKLLSSPDLVPAAPGGIPHDVVSCCDRRMPSRGVEGAWRHREGQLWREPLRLCGLRRGHFVSPRPASRNERTYSGAGPEQRSLCDCTQGRRGRHGAAGGSFGR
mmetsp:Transcript_15070/g.57213  ORF Transcript_15070/g.57213 Transcript_15070/m.57213 type:complete len:411 (+) Transcript_15070:234-1466(+)